ncbi:MAG: hypothetical protein H7Y32_21600 [Chloroflexales bacterium]|nr:hypothetical protein [Chloroflexales bacterium]
MRYARLVGFILVFAAVGGLATPAQAQDTRPPELAPLASVRDTAILLFNDRPLQVCERAWQSWNRVYGVCRDLATATVYDQRLIAGTTVEFVLFDGTRYERVNEATTWTASPDPEFRPDLPLGEALFQIDEQARVTRVGPADVAGTPTVQYQYWVLDEERTTQAGGQVVYDQFISSAQYVVKAHLSVRGSVAGLGDGTLMEIRTFRDFNAPVTIAPPAAATAT